jgi:hypothetical protein
MGRAVERRARILRLVNRARRRVIVMASNVLKSAVILFVVCAPVGVSAADATDATTNSNGAAAAARDSKAPPEKMAPNTATAPGVMAPKATPDAGRIGAQGPAAPTTPNGGPPAQNGNLSDRLGNADGVIHPNSNVDPGIEKPAPAGGSMPIVRPPDADSNVQPK